MDTQEASNLISNKLDAARKLLDECVCISEQSGVPFSLPWGGEGTSESGIGADYIPKTCDKLGYYDHTGWNPSAHTC